MRMIKMGAGCLVAACLAGVVAAGALAAPPEWGRCVESGTHTGGFNNSRCTLKAPTHNGAYEWVPEPSANPGFTGAGEEIALETTSGRKITCAASNAEGKYTGGKTESEKLFLVGCVTKSGTATLICRTTPGPKEGEIETNELEGEIGPIVVNERKKVGLDLRAKPPLTAIATFTCGTPPQTVTTDTVEGSVIAPIRPLNKPALEFLSVYRTVAAGVQQVQSFEGGEKDTLSLTLTEGLALPTTETAALHMKYVQTNEETVEIDTKA